MAEREIYRLDIKIGVNGDGETKKKLTATERFAKQSEKRIKVLDKIKASPSVKLQDRLSKSLDKVESKLKKFKAFASKKVVATITAGVIMAGGIGLGSAINTYMEYEQVLSNIKAVSGSTAAEMKQLDSLAIKLGAQTSFSAKEAAQGIEELSKAGLTTQQILNGGLAGALDLAAAGNLDLADAAEIASTALNAFRADNLTVSKAADILAGAANASATDVSELKYGLSQVSAVASAVGLSFKDTSTALAVFAQNGLKGGDAGTSLKTMLMNLQPKTDEQYKTFERLGLMTYDTNKAMQILSKNGIKTTGKSFEAVDKAMKKYISAQTKTKEGSAKFNKAYKEFTSQLGIAQSAFYDQNGNLKNMADIAEILQNSMRGLTSAQRSQVMETIFGSDAIRAANILYKEGAKGINNMASAMDKVTAKETAAEKLNNLYGAVEELKGAIETMKIDAISKIGPKLTQLVKWLTSKMPAVSDTIVGLFNKISNLADGFNSLGPVTQKFILGITFGTLALGPFVKTIGGMLGLGTKVGKFFGLFKGATAVVDTVKGVEAVKDVIQASEAVAKVAGSAQRSVNILSANGAVLSTVITGASTMIPTAKKAADATNTLGTAATVAAGTSGDGGIAGLASRFAPLLTSAAPWILGAAAVAGTGYLIYKGMTKEAVPAVDLFADKIESTGKRVDASAAGMRAAMETTTTKISQSAKEAIGAYMELDKKAQSSFLNLYVNGTKITKDTTASIMETYNQMGTQIKQGLDAKYNQMYSPMQNFFQKSSTLTDKEEGSILANMKKHNEDKKKEIDGYVKQINDILQKTQNRPLNIQEQQQISAIQEKMKTNAVQSLSQQEVETKIILERLKGYSQRVTAEQASSIIQNAERQRQEAVNKAEQQYHDTVANIIRMKDESHLITSAQADRLIADAEYQRDEAIKKAEELKQGIISKLQEITPDIKKEVNLQTGTIMTVWDKLKEWWNSWQFPKKTIEVENLQNTTMKDAYNRKVSAVSSKIEDTKKISGAVDYASGTSYASKGIHQVAEHGFEIVTGRQYRLFQGGEKVLNHRESKQFVESQAKPKFALAKPSLSLTGGGSNVNVEVDVENNFNNDIDLESIITQATKEFANKLRQSLKNIKR